MSISARNLDDWYMDEPDCQVEVRNKDEDGASVLQWRDHFTIRLSRKFSGLMSHSSETRTTRTSFTAKTSAAVTIIWFATDKKFFCTQDSCPISDSITGEGLQTQIWEHYTDWEDIPGTLIGSIGG
jgi:hypothetical protein